MPGIASTRPRDEGRAVLLRLLHIGTLHSKVPITDPGQIKGMKIRPANGTVAQLVTALGGTNVQLSAPEVRDTLEKGVAEAVTFPWKSILIFGIDKVTKYHGYCGSIRRASCG